MADSSALPEAFANDVGADLLIIEAHPADVRWRADRPPVPAGVQDPVKVEGGGKSSER